MENKLKSILSNLNDWLKFAETKNGYVIAFSGVFIFGCLSALKGSTCIWIIYYLYNFIIFQGLAFIIILGSFLPQTENPRLKAKDCKDSDNLLFYGDIRKYDAISYLDALCDSCRIERYYYTKLDINYANQIIIISKITTRKYLYFRFAFWFIISAFFTPLISFLIYYFVDPNNFLFGGKRKNGK